MQNWEQRHAGLVMVRILIKKLTRFLSELPTTGPDRNAIEFDEDVEETKIPKDVKEGYFAVMGSQWWEIKEVYLGAELSEESSIFEVIRAS
ncbi:hypothetical protein V6N13_059876 [Hibiscus sabdariffa]|uniref:Uncharacterized protein n=1 Tax=Hibiscus sabdariffa TaxID=183260 RepID=A0ABR2GBM8_9ROSI